MTINLRKCKPGDKLRSKHGIILTYSSFVPNEKYPHIVIYPNGGNGSRTDEGFCYHNISARLDTDHDIVEILSQNEDQSYAVVELNENKCIGYHPCKVKDEAHQVFQQIVSEYGVESYEEMIQEGIFQDDDGYTVQIVSSENSENS